MRRLEDVTELLWGSWVSASTVSNLNQKVYGKIEEWRNRPITGITILQARNQMKFRSLLYFVISLVSLGAQIPLAKYYGGIGCACAIAGALVLGQIIVMNIYYQVKQKINIVKFWVEIAKMSIVPGIMTVGGYFALQNFDLNSWISLGAGIGVYLIVYLPLFFAFSMNGYERDLVLNPVRKLIRK